MVSAWGPMFIVIEHHSKNICIEKSWGNLGYSNIYVICWIQNKCKFTLNM